MGEILLKYITEQKTENARDTAVTIDYRRKQGMRKIITKQSVTGENNECARY